METKVVLEDGMTIGGKVSGGHGDGPGGPTLGAVPVGAIDHVAILIPDVTTGGCFLQCGHILDEDGAIHAQGIKNAGLQQIAVRFTRRFFQDHAQQNITGIAA